jgi:hypothetical protein
MLGSAVRHRKKMPMDYTIIAHDRAVFISR